QRIAHLRLVRSVFLPVEDVEDVVCEGDLDFLLVLHGYFFVDAGRRRIDLSDSHAGGRAENRLPVAQQWNDALVRKGVYRLILPALARFAESAGPSAKMLEHLTSAIARSALFQKHAGLICEDEQWLLRVRTPNDSWHLRPANEAFYEIPAPDTQT